MNFDVSPFAKIRPISVRPGRWAKPGHPGNDDNALRTVLNFARYMKIPLIPAATMEKLRTDPYYKYCFYQLRYADTVYEPISQNRAIARARLKAILLKPELFNDNDLSLGLREYLNNFPAYFPGGYKSAYYQAPDGPTSNRDVFEAVNKVLGEEGKATALALRQAIQGEFQMGEKHAAYFKFCLGVFDTLVQRYRFAPERLWG